MTDSTNSIGHRIEYQNISDRMIVAIRFVFVSFDVWNKVLDISTITDMDTVDPYKKKKEDGAAKAISSLTFLTGTVFVHKVRFENGEIWEADLNPVIMELTKIEKGFDKEMLAEGMGE